VRIHVAHKKIDLLKLSEDCAGVNALPVCYYGVMLHVGLTGNIASGKSHAAQLFAELGAHIIDVDVVVHELLASNTKTHEKIVNAFGEQILRPDRSIDRRELGKIVFSDTNKRSLLNNLTHPDVAAEILRRIFALEQVYRTGIVIVDAALIIETGGHKMYDRLIVVTCDPLLQISRLTTRDHLTAEEARARMESQMAIEEKLKLADFTIDTSGTLKQTQEQVEAIYRDLLAQELRKKQHG
jgi:dephospho-CoA kinase